MDWLRIQNDWIFLFLVKTKSNPHTDGAVMWWGRVQMLTGQMESISIKKNQTINEPFHLSLINWNSTTIWNM